MEVFEHDKASSFRRIRYPLAPQDRLIYWASNQQILKCKWLRGGVNVLWMLSFKLTFFQLPILNRQHRHMFMYRGKPVVQKSDFLLSFMLVLTILIFHAMNVSLTCVFAVDGMIIDGMDDTFTNFYTFFQSKVHMEYCLDMMITDHLHLGKLRVLHSQLQMTSHVPESGILLQCLEHILRFFAHWFCCS